MGQYYILANVTKSQKMSSWLMKAYEIAANGFFQFWLMILLLDIEHQEKESTLENICLKSLAEIENREDYTKSLPSHLERKVDNCFLSQQLFGRWARDRLIITGDYSDFSPFPPNGDWKKGNLYDQVHETFSDSHADQVHKQFHENKTKIFQTFKKIIQGKDLKIVNLDNKEYVDPEAFGGRSISDCIMAEENHGSMCRLIITLIHSTGCGGGDLPSDVDHGMWAGDRIVICTPQQIDDFPSYTDVGYPSEMLDFLAWYIVKLNKDIIIHVMLLSCVTFCCLNDFAWHVHTIMYVDVIMVRLQSTLHNYIIRSVTLTCMEYCIAGNFRWCTFSYELPH